MSLFRLGVTGVSVHELLFAPQAEVHGFEDERFAARVPVIQSQKYCADEFPIYVLLPQQAFAGIHHAAPLLDVVGRDYLGAA